MDIFNVIVGLSSIITGVIALVIAIIEYCNFSSDKKTRRRRECELKKLKSCGEKVEKLIEKLEDIKENCAILRYLGYMERLHDKEFDSFEKFRKSLWGTERAKQGDGFIFCDDMLKKYIDIKDQAHRYIFKEVNSIYGTLLSCEDEFPLSRGIERYINCFRPFVCDMYPRYNKCSDKIKKELWDEQENNGYDLAYIKLCVARLAMLDGDKKKYSDAFDSDSKQYLSKAEDIYNNYLLPFYNVDDEMTKHYDELSVYLKEMKVRFSR